MAFWRSAHRNSSEVPFGVGGISPLFILLRNGVIENVCKKDLLGIKKMVV